ncbi:MAG: diacylglycerol kinase [Rhizobacter sp.]|nr:diacylglycerol kinase [Rhizobacter sp.]
MDAVDVPFGAAFFIVLNCGSGRKDVLATRETIAQVLSAAGREHHIEVVTDAKRLPEIARDTVARAKAANGVVVAAGGDGTINAMAQATLGSGCLFAVLPQGTFNYFSRTHGISSDAEQATRLLLTCRAHPVQVGLINERVFLVNASLGLYPQLLQDREAYKRQYGRSRLVALAAAIVTLFKDHRQMRLRIEEDGRSRELRTPTLFVGNNRLQMEQVGIPQAPRLDEGELAAVAIKPVGTLALLWLLARGALSRLGDADNVIHFSFRSITVTSRSKAASRRGAKVATDGEVVWMKPPLRFAVAPQPLLLIKPEPGPDHVDPDSAGEPEASP